MKFSAQEPGFILSGTAHLAVVLWGLLALSSPKPFDELAEAVPVDVISESQFREMTKGNPNEKQVVPNAPRRVDRIAKVEEDKDPGIEKRDVPTPPPPPLRPAVKEAEEETDPVPPPPRPAPQIAKLEPPKAPVQPPAPARPPEPRPEPKPQAMKPAPAKPTSAEEDEEEEEAAEIIRQRQKKIEAEKAAEARRAEDARKAEEARKEEAREKAEAARKAAEARRIEDERRKAEDKRKADEARKLAERREAEREAAAEREEARKEAAREAAEERAEAEREKAEAIRKAAEAQKLADARQKALDEQKKKAAEAARKAAEAKKAEEARKAAEKAESDKLQASIRNRLLASREAPASSGSSGQQVSRVASAGTPTGSGAKLSPSDREQLMGIIREQLQRCWSVPTTVAPAVKPLVRFQLGQNGALIAQPSLMNSGDSNFMAVAESGMRAIRQCAPYRIPAKFADKYNDWKTIAVRLDPSDLL